MNGREDYSVPMRQIDDPPPGLYGSDWEELVHPLGGTYFYHNKKNTYTSLNIRHMDRQRLEDFIDVSRATEKEDEWASEWRHKRFELEAQYWRHIEFFPHTFHMTCSQVRRTHREILCYLGEATTLNQSTAATIFWTLDQMRQVDVQLASVEALAENEIIEDTGVVLCCKILYMLRHYQYLNCHNQPEACLIRGHAVIEKRRTCKALYFMGNTAATILCMPITIDHIRNTSVDGIVNGVDVRTFIDDFSSQAKSQITLAGISVAMDIAIFAIPGLGTTVTSQTLCSCSLLLGVGCIFTATMVQHFDKKMRSIDFMVYYLQKKTMIYFPLSKCPSSPSIPAPIAPASPVTAPQPLRQSKTTSKHPAAPSYYNPPHSDDSDSHSNSDYDESSSDESLDQGGDVVPPAVPDVPPVVPIPDPVTPPPAAHPNPPPRPPPSPIGIGARLPQRNRQPPRDWWKLSPAQLTDVVDDETEDADFTQGFELAASTSCSTEPLSYREALTRVDAEQWNQAALEELNAYLLLWTCLK
ncbi:uncharacterized protein EDB91DRAFT_1256148 [Suillus paluster]|uniref:uncharacterized protein n=1 Tax=Suillus paluster TaxID=48578 RepID=UPI001B85F129|nr:uncharacterized protein EDB91DRAFT_1256148 [Suillus paluster]KAG1722281.1 hypothetical protein EDB91DRAFT_1256148 [Suillus paluster]